jgi:hypothetical protein
VVASAKVIDTLLSQLSVAVGALKVGVAGQLMGVVCVAHVIVGTTLSLTLNNCVHVVVIEPSDMVYTLVMRSVSVPQPVPVEVSETILVTGPQESTTITKAGLAAGTCDKHWNVPPLAGGQVTISEQHCSESRFTESDTAALRGGVEESVTVRVATKAPEVAK